MITMNNKELKLIEGRGLQVAIATDAPEVALIILS